MHDVIIIGAGPAGLSAALWCDQLGLDTLLLEAGAEIGGQLLGIHPPVENYLGLRAGRGIIESARRDRELFAGKDVCVVGGGDAAAENALLLAGVCATVTLVHRGKTLRARTEFTEQLQTNHCVTVFKEATLRRIIGGEEVEGVEIFRAGAIKPFEMAVRGVLVRIGVEPNTELFREQLHVDERGYIVVTGEQETSAGNVFAIGDVSNPLAPTISGATGAGATAAKVIASRLNS